MGGFFMKQKQSAWYFGGLMLLILTAQVSATEMGVNPWQIRINIPEYSLRLYCGSELYQTYKVAVGKAATPSPLGDFWITVKVRNPTWYPGDRRRPTRPGPANPLGGYWLGLNRKGYGIHGNNQAQSVGTPVSLGCFRMANPDIKELFRLVPVGTPVQVTYRTVSGWVDQNQNAFLSCFPDLYRQADRFTEARTVLQQLQWNYQPHYGALTNLLTNAAAMSVNVPRRIAVEVAGEKRDGFYWNSSFFVQSNPTDSEAESALFPGYTLIPVSGGLTKKYCCDWDPTAGVLRMEPLSPDF
jgi:L,D-transpeptidase ErfK/SrfK